MKRMAVGKKTATWFSGLVITRNAQACLHEVLEQLQKVTDDVIMVDSGSHDDTISIGRSTGARVFEPGWLGYGASRNFGAEQAKYDWILAIDADEVLSDPLIDTLKALSPEEHTIFVLDRANYIGKVWIRHSGMYPDWKPRLYPKRKVLWDNKPVHEELIIPDHFRLQRIPGKLRHYTSGDMASYKKKLDHYARLSAQSKLESGRTLSAAITWVGAIWRFLKVYVIQLGILDGRTGFQIAAHQCNMILQRKTYFDMMMQKKRSGSASGR